MTVKDDDIPIVAAELVQDEPNPDFAANPPAYAPGFTPPSAPIASMVASSNTTASYQQTKPPATTTTTTTTTYTIPAPADMAARVESYLGRNPKGFQCPYCQRQSVTRVRDRVDCVTLVIVITLLLLFWPLFWLPFCIPCCKSTDHYCSQCNRKIGTTNACE